MTIFRRFVGWGAALGLVVGWSVWRAATSGADEKSNPGSAPLTETELTDAELESLVGLYKHFHQHPELSNREEQTAAKLADELRSAGYEVVTGIGGHGLAAVLKNGSGKTLLIRTDLDALPVTEQTGLVYASTVTTKDDRGNEVGVMHACGHDIHMTALVGVARRLAANKERWQGTLVLIGQPAEERGEGAERMLKGGLFEKVGKPDFAIALHVDSTLEAGKVSCRGGYNFANVDSLNITVKGRGGHGAWPHTAIDPIVIAAKLVLDLQTIVSREIKPTEPAVVTVGAIHGGTKHNIIGDSCKLQLTVRSYSAETRKKLLDGIRRKAAAAAASADAPPPEIETTDAYTPALFNDEPLTLRVMEAMRGALGSERVVDAEPTLGGEDFSQFGLAGVPICMFRLGTVEPLRLKGYARLSEPPPPLHSAKFYPDAEPTLRTGVSAMSAAALELLGKKTASEAKR